MRTTSSLWDRLPLCPIPRKTDSGQFESTRHVPPCDLPGQSSSTQNKPRSQANVAENYPSPRHNEEEQPSEINTKAVILSEASRSFIARGSAEGPAVALAFAVVPVFAFARPHLKLNKPGCPILATPLSLWLGWETTKASPIMSFSPSLPQEIRRWFSI
jgi:hypothetical protein